MLVIDRFEGEYAVCECEDGSLVRIVKKLIAGNVREGDALDPWNGGFRVNVPKTRATHKRIQGKVQQLLEGAGPDHTT